MTARALRADLRQARLGEHRHGQRPALTASPSSHPDLYWACQGGGGGNFGIATWFRSSTTPAPSPVLFFLSWPWSKAAKVVAAWQSWAPNAPDALWSNLHLAAAPGGRTPTIQVGGCYLGSITGAHNLIDQLYGKVGSNATGYFLSNQYSYLNAMLFEAGCSRSAYRPATCPGTQSGGTLGRQPQFAKSDVLHQAADKRRDRTLLRGITNLQSVRGAAGGVGGVAFDALGGAVNRVSPTATAFVHRNALFGAQYTTDWTNGAAAAGINNQHAWLRTFWASMQPYANGQAYQNYIDPDLTNWPRPTTPRTTRGCRRSSGPTTRPACSTSRRPSCPQPGPRRWRSPDNSGKRPALLAQ